MKIKNRIEEYFRNLPPNDRTYYGPAQIQLNGKMDDVRVQSISNLLHKMADLGLIERRLMQDSDYPPARRYGYRCWREDKPYGWSSAIMDSST